MAAAEVWLLCDKFAVFVGTCGELWSVVDGDDERATQLPHVPGTQVPYVHTVVAVSSRGGAAEASAVETRAVVGCVLLEGGVFRLLPLSRPLWRPTARLRCEPVNDHFYSICLMEDVFGWLGGR